MAASTGRNADVVDQGLPPAGSASGRLRRWRHMSAAVLVLWTVFLWLSRLRNVVADEDLTSGGRAVRIAVVVVFVLLALGSVAERVRRGSWGVVLSVLIVWTIGYWLVRGTGILIGDWSVGFKVVHTVLMVVSLTLAVLAWRFRGSGSSAALSR